MSPLIGAAGSTILDRLQFDPLAWHHTAHASGNHDAPASRIAPVSGETGPPAAASNSHILVVDDESDIRRILRALLEEEGYTVSEAVDGADGLAVIRASAHPLIVLLDYKMPRMNGAEMLRAVMADPQLAGRHAFIFVTANLLAFSPELLQLLTAAAIPVIEKPFSISVLLEEIERTSSRLQGSPADPTC
jgi:two-component system, chemotaxis family, chemotaxis protein CheY